MKRTKKIMLGIVLSWIIPWALGSAFGANVALLEVHETEGALPSDNSAISMTLDSTDSLEPQLEPSFATGDFYYTLHDDEIEGATSFVYTKLYPDGTNLKKFSCSLTNIAPYMLEDLSWAIQFTYYFANSPEINEAFSYYNDDHTWYLHKGMPYEKWTRTHGVMGQNELLSMDRRVTQAPLFRKWYIATAYLAETDEVTLISFGDIEPGETVVRDVYFKANFIGLSFRGYLLSTTHEPRTYYVDDDGPADFNNIQAAVDSAYDGDTVVVADGTYTGEGNRDIDFLGKAITVKSENGPENCIIDCDAMWSDYHCGFDLSSNQDTNSVIDGFTIINGYTSDRSGGIYCRNSALTISNCNISGNAVWGGRGGGYGGGIFLIDGIYSIYNCTISNNSTEYGGGGGISCLRSALTVSTCTINVNSGDAVGGIDCEDSIAIISDSTIRGNEGYRGGGGIECYQSCMTINDCNICENEAEKSWWYSQGGGVRCYDSNSTIINCTIRGNTNGGIYCKDSTSIISNCKISGNITCQDTTLEQCGGSGGGIYCDGSSSTIKNCIISGNTCGDEGGGICYKNSSSIISNCTFAGNSSYNGNSLACISPFWQAQYPSSVEVSNCIMWNGGEEIFNNDGSTITVSYSDIQGGWEGQGNIDADPCFADSGFWDANGTLDDTTDDFWVEGDYHLLPGSLCIDAGDPCYVPEPNETDLNGNPRVINGRIDMGAYEADYIEVSMKLTPQRIIRHSRKKLIMALLRLPEDITKDQIDSNEPLLLYPGGIEAERRYVFEHGKRGDKRVSIFAFFDKSELTEAVPDNGQVQLEVVGYLTTGQQFYGTDFVTILDRRQPRKR